MPYPHEVNLKNMKTVNWRSLGYKEPPDDLTEFWEAVESLPDLIGKKDFKSIIKKLYKKDGTPDFADWKDLGTKLKKSKTEKGDQEAFQEWHTAMKIIRERVPQQIHMNRRKKERDDRKSRIKQEKVDRKARREADGYPTVATSAIEGDL